jgi:transcriptional regulator GlxA family with amidase domain
MLNVEVLVLEGAMVSGVSVTFEMLGAVDRLLRSSGKPPVFAVRGSGDGFKLLEPVLPSPAVSAVGTADLVIVPGLGLADEQALRSGLASPGAERARARLSQAANEGASIAASCSGTFLLASAGLLDGRRATTSWWLAPIFSRMFPKVELEADAMVVSDGPVTTAGAAMAQADLMLTLIARHADATIADTCARYLVLDGRQSQAPYASIALLAASDDRMARMLSWARTRLESGVTVKQMADHAGLTPRTFARQLERATGLSPVRFLQRVRLEQAVKLARSTRLPFEEIARRVGYADPTTLRRVMRREGLSARALRGPVERQAA